ncbi:hypothetical protein J1614_006518 [Plenodomus biglobosus]|nr:hypothetical protein J1614_006518 [Plenodomus biglobosus]
MKYENTGGGMQFYYHHTQALICTLRQGVEVDLEQIYFQPETFETMQGDSRHNALTLYHSHCNPPTLHQVFPTNPLSELQVSKTQPREQEQNFKQGNQSNLSNATNKRLSPSILAMVFTPSLSVVIITITDYSTVYPTTTMASSTHPSSIPPSAGPSVSASSTTVPAPSASNSADPVRHDPFDIGSLIPMFIAISCIALLLVILFAYAVWSKCCIGGRFGVGFGCSECKVLKAELEQWKNGEKKRITRAMVHQRDSYNSEIRGDTGSTAHLETISAPSYADNRTSTNDPELDLASARAATLATLQGHPTHPQRTPSLPSNPLWTTLKSRFATLTNRTTLPPTSDIETADNDRFFNLDLNTLPPRTTPYPYSPSIYSQATFHHQTSTQHPGPQQHYPLRSFNDHTSPNIPSRLQPRTHRTSVDAPKSYLAYG